LKEKELNLKGKYGRFHKAKVVIKEAKRRKIWS
jgi:hypothetical protein